MKKECMTWRKAASCELYESWAIQLCVCVWVLLGQALDTGVLTWIYDVINMLIYACKACFLATPQSVHVYVFTYPRDELSDHAGPRSVGSRNAVQSIPHQPDAILELENICQLLQHVHTEAFVAVVSLQFLVVWPQHHIWVLLKKHMVCIEDISNWLSIKGSKTKQDGE